MVCMTSNSANLYDFKINLNSNVAHINSANTSQTTVHNKVI